MFEKDERAIAYERRKRERRRLVYERRRWRDTRDRRKRFIALKVVCFLCFLGGLYLLKDPVMEQVNRMMPYTSGAGDVPVEEVTEPQSEIIIEKRKPTILDSLITDYPDVQEIINRIDEYPRAIIDMVLNNQETIPYAIDFVDTYPIQELDTDIELSPTYIEGEFPLFMQWDKKWGYHQYSGRAMAFTGCGPVTLSMAYVGLTGDITKHPLVMASFATENGYAANGSGSSWTLISEGAKKLGLAVKELTLTKKKIINTLEDGKVIIAVMGPGAFTQGGHFILLKGVDENGKIIVNDSNSIKNSNTTWDVEVFLEETKNLWSLELANE